VALLLSSAFPDRASIAGAYWTAVVSHRLSRLG
jgi:hypothetical protein